MVETATGCFFDAQTTTVATAGVRVQLSSSPEHIGSISITALSGNTGDIFFGGSTVRSTVGKTLAPGQTIIVRAQEGKTFLLSDFWVDAANNGDKIEWVVGAIVVSTTVVPENVIAITRLDIDGAADIGAAIVDADLGIIDDGAGGTNRKFAFSRIKTYIGAGTMSNVVEDLSPQWGANIDFNGFDASGIGHLGFLASQDASAGANDFDDYKEATFTVTVQDNSRSDAESQTYTTQVGWSTKIGNIFQFGIAFEGLDLGTLTTSQGAVLAGLPVTSQNTANHRSGFGIGLGQQLAITAGQTVSGYINPNETVVNLYLWDAAGGQTAFLLSELSDNGLLYLGGAYETA